MTDRNNGTEPGRQMTPTTVSALTEPTIQLDPAFQGESAAPPENPFQIGRIISAIQRYKWLVLAVATLGIAGSILATRFITPQFQTSATIYIQNGGVARSGPIRADQLLASDSWVQLVRSYAVIDPVVRQMRLYLGRPKEDSLAFSGFELANRFQPGSFLLKLDEQGRNYSLTTAKGQQIEAGVVGDSIGLRLGLRWLPPPGSLGAARDIPFSVRPPRAVSEALQARLRANLPRDGVMMGLVLTDTDPERAAGTLNAILNQFVQIADQLKRSKLAKVTKDLREQIRIADSNTRAAETTLESYRITTITQPKLEQQSPVSAGLQQTQPTVMSSYFNKRIRLKDLQTDRNAIEEVLRRGLASGAISVDAFHTINAVKQAPDFVLVLQEVSKTEAELRALRSRYTDEYAGIKTLLVKLNELTMTTVPSYATRLVTQLKSQEAALQTELADDTEELRQIPVRTHTEDKYQRDAQSAIKLSAELSSRFEENRLAELTATPDVSVLDPAEVPDRPSSNTAPMIILMGVAGSIGLALVLAILLDRLDKRFRYPDQVSNGLGLSVLGAVPVINRGRAPMAPAETAQIVEAFRSIRLNLAHSFVDGEPIVLTITSPSPGDGKSLVSANLAMSFAEAGYQTVLVDGDTRRGELHRVFGGDRTPGLLDHLDGSAGFESALRITSHAGLTFVPCGTRSSRGPELLSSAAMVDFLQNLKSRYQVVLVDSPPLAAGIDPFVLGTVTGNVVVVLRAGETDRELAKAKLQLMDRLPARMLGAILNHIDVGSGSYKYYAYEYTDRTDDQPAPKTSDRGVSLPTG